MMTESRHAVIEASAGTGKTYTIENEVVRLIVDEGIPLTRILIVTFTEKATGELRRRVREKLEAAWRKDPHGPRAAELRASIDAFDDAAIYTIHGFCARMLSEYAFETRLPFTLQQLDDPLIWERLFARSLRGYWRRVILTDDDPLRNRLAFDGKFYQDDVLRVAKQLMPGDILLPEPTTPLASASQTVSMHLTTLQRTFGMVPADVSQSPFLAQLSALKLHGSTKKSLQTHYAGFLSLLQRYQQEGLTDEVLGDVCGWHPSDTLAKHLPTLIEHGLLTEQDEGAFIGILGVQDGLKAGIITHAIKQLADSMSRYKREGGFIDFNDMLLLVREAMQQAPALIRLLRERYAVALVDEFQDTDQVQWEIFRTVFADDAHRLIVVGDPKQAIYSFRGANVNAYLAACNDLATHGGERHSLDTNWRSYPPLVQALNDLFAPATGWFGEGAIQHTAIAVPPPDLVRARCYADGSGRRPLTLVQQPAGMSGGDARVAYARFVAHEIRHLLASDIEIVEWRGATPYRRPLHPGDLCILIHRRSELPVLDRALRWADIPYSFPKQGGLFATREAQEWRYLLRAIAAPDDPQAVMTALLTRFFACPPETLERYPALPGTHPIKLTLARWHELVERRAWALLFQAVFEDTAILVREVALADGERTVTNHQHLAQLLHEQAVRTRGTLEDLIAFLDNRCVRGGDDETDLQRIETERRKVQIMTMHAAKGLEFPVVFLAGGFTAGAGGKGCPSYTTPTGRVYAFDCNEEAERLAAEEADQDNRRLYYVALTRAKYKLYVPHLAQLKRKTGPLATFIADAIERAWPSESWDGDDRVAYLPINENGLPLPTAGQWRAPLDAAAGVAPLAAADAAPVIDESRLALPVIDPAWGQRVTRVASYSSLAAQEEAAADLPALQYAAPAETAPAIARPVEDDASDVPVVAEEADNLPHGAATGTLLHAVLEEIDYPAVLAAEEPEALLRDDATTQACIDRLLDRYPLRREGNLETDRAHIARIVWQALHTPMPFLDGLPLGALTDRRHEVEFWLPAPGLRVVGVPDIRLEHTYLSGFIDLVFRHAGRYYVLDWKSNWSPSGDYGQATLEGIMSEHQYDLQYRIYQVALDRLLRLSVPGYDPARHLGGICYLFLRGVGTGETGIYFVPADAINLTQTTTDLLRRLGAAMSSGEAS